MLHSRFVNSPTEYEIYSWFLSCSLLRLGECLCSCSATDPLVGCDYSWHLQAPHLIFWPDILDAWDCNTGAQMRCALQLSALHLTATLHRGAFPDHSLYLFFFMTCHKTIQWSSMRSLSIRLPNSDQNGFIETKRSQSPRSHLTKHMAFRSYLKLVANRRNLCFAASQTYQPPPSFALGRASLKLPMAA